MGCSSDEVQHSRRAGAAESLSEKVRWQLAQALFAQREVLIIGGLVLPAVGVLCAFRTGQGWYISWSLAAIVLLLMRLALDAAFARRTSSTGSPRRWQLAFLAGAWGNGLLCGLGGAGAVLGAADAFTQMLVITMLTAFVMGSAARNASYPPAAIGSGILAEAPLLVACLWTRDIFYVLYSPLSAVFTLSAVAVVRHLYGQIVALLRTDEEKAELVATVSRTNAELEAANLRLASIAATDGLTGVANRRSFDESLEREVRRAERDGTDLSVLLLDIDSFKAYNDRYGHQRGDDGLRQVAASIAGCVNRPGDVVARYGGEEFAVVLPLTGTSGAAAVAQDIRTAVEALGIEHAAGVCGCVTVSVGVATLARERGERADQVVGRADAALYAAKRSGRNRVLVSPGEQAASRLASRPAEEVVPS